VGTIVEAAKGGNKSLTAANKQGSFGALVRNRWMRYLSHAKQFE
jgi:hypothetical protein